MMVDVVLLPRDLRPGQLSDRTAVVFDVLRATTTMTAALVAGVREIQIFGNLESAIEAGRNFKGPHLLCGERNAIKPQGFDLGNSPGVFQREHHQDVTLLMTTTNGTVAILAAKEAASIFIAALVNAEAVAQVLSNLPRDVICLCAGTEGFVSSEDVLGAGALIDALDRRTQIRLNSDIAWMALKLFRAQCSRLAEALSESRGGHNIARAGLTPDIPFCANLNSIDCVGVVEGHAPIVRRFNGAA